MQNLARHRSHYSFMGMLGPLAVTAVADRLGVGIYFDTLVPWETHVSPAQTPLLCIWFPPAGRLLLLLPFSSGHRVRVSIL